MLVSDQHGVQPVTLAYPSDHAPGSINSRAKPVTSNTQKWPKWVICTTPTVLRSPSTATTTPETARTDSVSGGRRAYNARREQAAGKPAARMSRSAKHPDPQSSQRAEVGRGVA